MKSVLQKKQLKQVRVMTGFILMMTMMTVPNMIMIKLPAIILKVVTGMGRIVFMMVMRVEMTAINILHQTNVL